MFRRVIDRIYDDLLGLDDAGDEDGGRDD